MKATEICPHCNTPLTPFNLQEDDPRLCLIFKSAKLEEGLTDHGLECSGNPRHTFGLLNVLEMVEIEYRLSKTMATPSSATFMERTADGTANVLFKFAKWAPFSEPIWNALREMVPSWQVVEAWHKLYNPNGIWHPDGARFDRMMARLGREAQREKLWDAVINAQDAYLAGGSDLDACQIDAFEFPGAEEDGSEEK